MRLSSLPLALPLAGALLSLSSLAEAGVEDWELNELYQDSTELPPLRFVELVNHQGGCLFPSSTLDLYDAQGELIDTQPLVNAAKCFDPPAYFLVSTLATDNSFGVERDATLAQGLPAAGQLCFSSSATDYDCVRWGAIDTPVVDLFGVSDLTSLAALPDAQSLARSQTTHVIADDWGLSMPTPRQPNDGSILEIPDAGPTPDAAPIADAGPEPDAARRPDAAPPIDADTEVRNTDYLDLDAGGGAACSCQSASGGAGWPWLVALLVLLRRRQRL